MESTSLAYKLTDHLSRAYLASKWEEDEEFQVFPLEVETLNPLDSFTFSSERLAQPQKATKQDAVWTPKLDSNNVGRMAWTEK